MKTKIHYQKGDSACSGSAQRKGGRLARLVVVLASLTATLGLKSGLAQAADPTVVGCQTVYSFAQEPVGTDPEGGLIVGSDGALYGTTSSGGGGLSDGTVFRVNQDGSGFTLLKRFERPWGQRQTGQPAAQLLQASDGALYGTTGYGTIFKLNKDGTEFTVLRLPGEAPSAMHCRLVEGSDGALYGTDAYGDTGYGCIFKLNKNGSSFTVLKNFLRGEEDGFCPNTSLLKGRDGVLYGSTSYRIVNGVGGPGSVFRINQDGTDYRALKAFSGQEYQYNDLVEGSDGVLYGATMYGGGNGSIFKLNRDGTGYAVIKQFGGDDGAWPRAGLIEGSDRALYGTTLIGGSANIGTVFKLNKDGTGFTVLKSLLREGDEGLNPGAGLVEGDGGMLFGVASSTSVGWGTVFRIKNDGTDFGVLHRFSRTGGDAYCPQAGVIEASDGNLYGTTALGGAATNYGTVFRVGKDGTGFVVLKNFTRTSTDGGGPNASLLEGSDRALYGATPYGGPSDSGTIFKVNKDGSGYAVLKAFDTSACDPATGAYDPAVPNGPLIEARDGALYGTTQRSPWGGAGGTVFRLNKDGTGFTVLSSLGGNNTGVYPVSGVVEGSDGALYGTTTWGAMVGGQRALGSVYRVTKDGASLTALKVFAEEEGVPIGGLIEGTDGALYGTTEGYVFGTVYRLNRDGTAFTVLSRFERGLWTALKEGSDGALYGTSENGGSSGLGLVFRVNKDGTGFAVLKEFTGLSGDGCQPQSALIQGRDGAFYGTTSQGGDSFVGAIFRLDVGLGPLNTAPVAQCKDVTVSAGPDCAAAASIDDGSFDPDPGDTITVLQSPPGPYPLGPALVTLTVTDSHGASASCKATVTVVDTAPPSIAAPPPVVVATDPGKCEASNVALGEAVATDNCGVASIVNNAPAVFQKSTTTVTWTATDNAGNPATATQTVTVIDTEHPTIVAPADVFVASDAGACTAATAVALGQPTTADNCGVASVVNDHPSTSFPLGETLVTWTVTDTSGLTAMAVQKVTVLKSVSLPIQSPLAPAPVANKIRRGQVVMHRVALTDCSGLPLTAGVTVKLKVQGIDSANNTVFQDVIEEANGQGSDGTVTSDGIMQLQGDTYRFNLDTGNFNDPNTLGTARYYRSTITVIDNATLTVLGTVSVILETRP